MQIAAQGMFFILVVRMVDMIKHIDLHYHSQVVLILHNLRENRRRARGERDYRLNADESVVAKLGSLHPKFRLVV